MLELSGLSPAPGSNRNKKRLGRGIGSGLGKTSGKGHKGQKARSGASFIAGFEGGQNPLYKRIPKHGFTNLRTKKVYNIVKTSDLAVFNDGEVVNRESLGIKGLLRDPKNPIKILVSGELDRKLEVQVEKVSKGAKDAIEGKGGLVKEN